VKPKKAKGKSKPSSSPSPPPVKPKKGKRGSKEPTSPLIDLIPTPDSERSVSIKKADTAKRADFSTELVISPRTAKRLDETHDEFWNTYYDKTGRGKKASKSETPQPRKTKTVPVKKDRVSPSKPKTKPKSPPKSPAKKVNLPTFRGEVIPAIRGPDADFVPVDPADKNKQPTISGKQVNAKRLEIDPEGKYDNLRFYQIENLQRDYRRARRLDALVDKYFIDRECDKNVYQKLMNLVKAESDNIHLIKEYLCNLYYNPEELDHAITGNRDGVALTSKEAVIDYHLGLLTKKELVKKITPLVESWKDGSLEKRRMDDVRENIAKYREIRDEFIFRKNQTFSHAVEKRQNELLKQMRILEKQVGCRDMDAALDFRIVSKLAEIVVGANDRTKKARFNLNAVEERVNLRSILATKDRTDGNYQNRIKKLRDYISSYNTRGPVDEFESGWMKIMKNVADTMIDKHTGLPMETTDVYEDTLVYPSGEERIKFDPTAKRRAANVLDPGVLTMYYQLKTDIDYADKTDLELQTMAVQSCYGNKVCPRCSTKNCTDLNHRLGPNGEVATHSLLDEFSDSEDDFITTDEEDSEEDKVNEAVTHTYNDEDDEDDE
jgi:hypothetical protein